MRKVLYIFILITLISCIKQIEETNIKELKGNYLGQKLPGDTPIVFAEGIVSNQFNVRDAAISPDGNDFFYSIRGAALHSIIWIKRIDNVWKDAEVAPFSGKYSDIEPCFSPDGRILYFVSNRPIDSIGEPKDYDIWYVEKGTDNWSEPRNIGLPVNTDSDEFYPSFTKNGDLYYCANYENGIGGEDLYFSEFKDGAFLNPINLGDSVNSIRDEFNSFVSPDGNYIIYTSMGWGTGIGGGDLWISFKNNNVWRKPIYLGDKINSPFFEYCPSISPDGKYFFFTSNRNSKIGYSSSKIDIQEIIDDLTSTENGSQNIYWVKSDFIQSLKK